MTPIQIESKNSVLNIVFSHRTGKNGDICLHTGPLEGQNVLESIGKHLAQPGPAVEFQENGFFILYFDSISNRVTSTLQYTFKQNVSNSQYFQKCHF